MPNDTEIDRLHQEVLYPTVRVRSIAGGGSGTVIYSKKNAVGEFETYIITNHHVIEKAIQIKEEWDPYLRRKVNKEVRNTVWVDRFRYEDASVCVGQEAIEADIVAWDKDEDIALVRPRLKATVWPSVARLIGRDGEKRLRMFQAIRACGCSLLHEPFSTIGEITGMNDEVENRRYFMASSMITFGNSGGAVYTEPGHEFIGIPSLVSVQGEDDLANFMGYFIPPHRWYAFLQRHYFDFIWTGEDPADYHARRERRQQRADTAIEAIRQGVLDDRDVGGQTPQSPELEIPEGGAALPLPPQGDEPDLYGDDDGIGE